MTFEPSLIFVSKAGVYPNREPTLRSSQIFSRRNSAYPCKAPNDTRILGHVPRHAGTNAVAYFAGVPRGKNVHNTATCGQGYKTFYGRKLRIFAIS
jgi:hypothetical protein